MRADSSLWDVLTQFNEAADALIAKAMRAVEPSPPISREVPFFASIEIEWNGIPANLTTAPGTASDVLYGANVKRGIFTNNSSRVYVRELGFNFFYADESGGAGYAGLSRSGGAGAGASFLNNWRWNFETSITQKKYADKRVAWRSAGNLLAGNHLTFSDPLVIEPRETFIFEGELLNAQSSYRGQTATFIVAMLLAGYREAF